MHKLSFFVKKRRKQFSGSRGFTLIELLVALFVIGVILGIVVYNHGKFDSEMELTNIAYRVALSIRQAQIFGVSVRQYKVGSIDSFNVPYGVNFYIGSEDAKKTYVFFADSNANSNPSKNNPYIFDHDTTNTTGCPGPAGSNPDECIERMTFGRGNTVARFCVVQDDTGVVCFPDTGGNLPTYADADSLNVVFKRPKVDAIITLSKTDSGGNITPVSPPFGVTLVEAFVCLQSPQGKLKKVVVSQAGQISVQNVASLGNQCASNVVNSNYVNESGGNNEFIP